MRTAQQRLDWAVDYCRRLRLRSSPLRQSILAFLAAQGLPVSLTAIAGAEGLRGHCDPATIYRTLTLFTDAQVVRQLRFHGRVSYFALNAPGELFHYFVCARCGEFRELAIREQARLRANELAIDDAGQGQSYDGILVFGLCRRCQSSHQRSVPTSKVTPRLAM